MPGLLQTPSGHFAEAKFVYALIAEFIGVMLFAFAGSATPQGNVSTQQSTMTDTDQQDSGSANWAPWGNGMSLAVLIYITANISGGHLNPAVTLATIVTGHISFLKGLAYMFVQICGACFGMLMVAGLVPGSYVGMGNNGTGCFTRGTDVTMGMLFGWETVMTFVLVSVVYAVAVGEPSFGNFGPYAVGLSLFSMVFAGSQFTGTAINPARALGPAIVFHCHWNEVWLYIIAEGVGGVIAGLVAAPLYGVGATWLTGLVPWQKRSESPDGPSGRLVDHAASMERKKNRAYKYQHRATDSASSPEAEQQPLETIV